MRKKPDGARTAWIMVAAALLVLGVLLAAFLSTNKASNRNAITLPDGTVQPPGPAEEPDAGQPFLQVDAGNVQQTLKTLQRPEAYHQTLTATVYWEGGDGVKTVEQWRSGSLTRAQITETGRRRHVLSDGKQAWVWYDGDIAAAAFPLDEGRTLESLIGVAGYETVMTLPKEQIADAAFGPAADDETINSLWLRTKPDAAGYEQTYWVDVATQLLWKAQLGRDGEVTYVLQQTAFERLEGTDAALNGLFTLPDGRALTAQ